MKASKDSEVGQLRDQISRLQVQLNHGHTGFADFREKKSAEIELLQAELTKLKEQVLAFVGLKGVFPQQIRK